MESLKKLVEGGFAKDRNLNCAETILCGANEAYELKIPKNTLKIAAGLGGGLGVGSVCGALSASVMVLGLLFVKEKAREEGSQIKKLSQEFLNDFEQRMQGIDCVDLIPKHRTKESGCHKIIVVAAEILDEIVSRRGDITLEAAEYSND